MSHMATRSMWTNALFNVQIQVCQLDVEPRNFAGWVIYVGHVSSIARFSIINIVNTTFATNNCTGLFEIRKIYIWQQIWAQQNQKLLDQPAASITATHILLEPTTKWHLKAWHSTDSLGLFKVGPHCWHHPYLLNYSPIMNIDVYNNVRIRAPVSARALCQQRLHERNPSRLSQIGRGDRWYSNPKLPLGPCKDMIGG